MDGINELIKEFMARRVYLNLSHQQLADRLHKDVTTVQKQLSQTNSGMNLATAFDYAEALEGRLEFITAEQKNEYSTVGTAALRAKIAELTTQNERLTEKLKEKDETIKELKTLNFQFQHRMMAVLEKLAEKI